MGVAGIGGVILAACGSSAPRSAATASATAAASSGADCVAIPEETAGPYPGEGSNGPDVLSQTGIVRRDIRSSFGELSGTAEGVPLTIRLSRCIRTWRPRPTPRT